MGGVGALEPVSGLRSRTRPPRRGKNRASVMGGGPVSLPKSDHGSFLFLDKNKQTAATLAA